MPTLGPKVFQNHAYSERQQDGSCAVPDSVRDAWVAGGTSREELLKLFIENNLDKEAFVKHVTFEAKKSREMKLAVTGDFFTKEEMRDDLKLPKLPGMFIRPWEV